MVWQIIILNNIILNVDKPHILKMTGPVPICTPYFFKQLYLQLLLGLENYYFVFKENEAYPLRIWNHLPRCKIQTFTLDSQVNVKFRRKTLSLLAKAKIP